LTPFFIILNTNFVRRKLQIYKKEKIDIFGEENIVAKKRGFFI